MEQVFLWMFGVGGGLAILSAMVGMMTSDFAGTATFKERMFEVVQVVTMAFFCLGAVAAGVGLIGTLVVAMAEGR